MATRNEEIIAENKNVEQIVILIGDILTLTLSSGTVFVCLMTF